MTEFNPEKTEFKDLNLEQMITNQESEKLSVLNDEWEKRIRQADATQQIVEQAGLAIEKELIELRDNLSKKRKEQLDNESVVKKGSHNIRNLKSEKKNIEWAFWRSKGK